LLAWQAIDAFRTGWSLSAVPMQAVPMQALPVEVAPRSPDGPRPATGVASGSL